MRVLGLSRVNRDNPHVDSYFEKHDLHSALEESDFVALCLALTPETRRIINAPALAAMKPTAFLINVTRGGLVDETALIEALTNRRIAGAGLDATETEPPLDDSPLWDMPNVIMTPHISPARDGVGSYMVDFWCDQALRRRPAPFGVGRP